MRLTSLVFLPKHWPESEQQSENENHENCRLGKPLEPQEIEIPNFGDRGALVKILASRV